MRQLGRWRMLGVAARPSNQGAGDDPESLRRNLYPEGERRQVGYEADNLHQSDGADADPLTESALLDCFVVLEQQTEPAQHEPYRCWLPQAPLPKPEL